ncbi:hypothetical protein J4Q44_G00043320 [Coregonus suidteri]|uniref:Uncharacterized protein n=1 Tax=Coregonus suidteri TaxID=861788 RepID=A0AAN8M503_9TELE
MWSRKWSHTHLYSLNHSILLYNYFHLRKLCLFLLDMTPLLAQPQPSQLQSSAPAPATPAATGDTDLPRPSSSAAVTGVLCCVPTTLAVKGETFVDSQMDTDLPCTPPLPRSAYTGPIKTDKAEMGG